MMEATDSWRFEEGVYNLQDLCYKHPPPVVVQRDHEKSEVTVDNVTFDLSQPILLYRQRNINKVSAKFVHKEIYRETGPPLLIPEDYKGKYKKRDRVGPPLLMLEDYKGKYKNRQGRATSSHT
jgi:hypothetical protein